MRLFYFLFYNKNISIDEDIISMLGKLLLVVKD